MPRWHKAAMQGRENTAIGLVFKQLLGRPTLGPLREHAHFAIKVQYPGWMTHEVPRIWRNFLTGLRLTLIFHRKLVGTAMDVACLSLWVCVPSLWSQLLREIVTEKRPAKGFQQWEDSEQYRIWECFLPSWKKRYQYESVFSSLHSEGIL